VGPEAYSERGVNARGGTRRWGVDIASFLVSDVIVLLGAPGSGKSTVGEALGARGFRWRDWEPVILERWGTRDAFIAEKKHALQLLHDEIVKWVSSDQTPAVLESTGLSDEPLLSQLVESRGAFIVRLDVPEDEALRRIAEREQGRHLSDALEVNRVVWRAFHEHVVPRRRADLVVDTAAQSVESTVEAIISAVHR
jgi:shikimate kinase